jgi:hypothetical protein
MFKFTDVETNHGMKEFRPTHEIKHDIFYLACTGLVNQGKRLPSPMLAKKNLHLVKCKQFKHARFV